MRHAAILAILGLLGTPAVSLGFEPPPEIRILGVPGGGVQPRAAVDASGAVHLVYLRGEPGRSDVYYASWKPGEPGFGPEVRVNSEAGSALAIGTVRGAQIALGRNGRIHVAWNGSTNANPLGGSPMLYARSDESRTSFEPQRNLMARTTALDGGGSIAADDSGDVYVAWHGQTKGDKGEENRKLWIARSTDDGATFAPESPAWDRPTGACACCGTQALVDSRGTLSVLYRSATDGVERGSVLLTSVDKGRRFEGATLQPWRIAACPMSTYALADAGPDTLAAWETKGQVYYARVGATPTEAPAPISPGGGEGTRKHPAIAANARGQVVLAWTEGTGWQKGGAVAWQAFDKSGTPIGASARMEKGVPTWGHPAVLLLPGGGFAILH